MKKKVTLFCIGLLVVGLSLVLMVAFNYTIKENDSGFAWGFLMANGLKPFAEYLCGAK